MIIAVKSNKQVSISQDAVTRYAAEGFDVYEVHNGKRELVKHAANKTVPYGTYEKLKADLDKLKAENDKLRKTKGGS